MGQRKEVRPRKQKGRGTGTGKADTPEQREDRGIRAGTTNNRQGTLLSCRPDVSPYTGILQKEPSSFRLQRKPLIILKLQTEGCFRYLSAKLHFIWRRTENRSPEIEKSFGWELFTAFRNERKLKDTWNILHSVIHYKITLYSKYWKMKGIFLNSWRGKREGTWRRSEKNAWITI